MAVSRRQVDGAAARAVTRLGSLHLQFRTGGEPLSKARNELVADVLDNENRRRKGGGELRQQLAERLRTAGRSRDGDNLIGGRDGECLLAARRRRPRRTVPHGAHISQDRKSTRLNSSH